MGNQSARVDVEFLHDFARELGSRARTLQEKGFDELATEAAELQRKALSVKRQTELAEKGGA